MLNFYHPAFMAVGAFTVSYLLTDMAGMKYTPNVHAAITAAGAAVLMDLLI